VRALPTLLLLTACSGSSAGGGLVPFDTVDPVDSIAPDEDTPDADSPAEPPADTPAVDDTPVDPPTETAPDTAAPPADTPQDTDPSGDSDAPDPTADTAAPLDSGPPPPPPWSAPLTVDGAWDCPADAELATTSSAALPSARACVTWTATDLFIAMRHPDVANGGASHFLVAYLGDGAGTQTGPRYNTQQPGLPLPVSHHLRWKPDGSYDSLLRWDGAAWVEVAAPYLAGPSADVAERDREQVVEWRIPLADLALGRRVDLALGWIFEGAGFESTYAAVPVDTLLDGYDRDWATMFSFDLDSPLPPAQYAPVP
jgi:hypothetical protein